MKERKHDKALLIATLLKAEGDIYEDQGNPEAAYESNLKSLNLFLEILMCDDNLHDCDDTWKATGSKNQWQE